MSEDLERLRELYRRWGVGDFTDSSLFDPAIESRSFGTWPDMQGGIKGLPELRRAMAGWLSAWERPLVIEVEEFAEAGGRILALVRWRGHGKESGVEMEAIGAHLWTFRGGLAIRFDVYRDRDEAHAALAGG